MRAYTLRRSGPVVAAFGLGLVMAKLLPYSALLLVAAASMILVGVMLCRC